MTDRQVNVIPVREEQPLISRGIIVTRKVSAIGKVMFEQRSGYPAVSEWALRSDCLMHPERTVSFRPGGHEVLWQETGACAEGVGVVINGNICNTTFVAYDLLNASAWGTYKDFGKTKKKKKGGNTHDTDDMIEWVNDYVKLTNKTKWII